MARVVFVIGGARSGKSGFALARASRETGAKVFVATAQAFDREMEERIAKHRSERESEWDTHEEPLHLDRAVREVSGKYRVAIVDCLTLWLSNLLAANLDVEGATRSFADSLRGLAGDFQIFIVSNEVGMGIVPENPLARMFRDMAGKLNQQVAEIADEVFLVAAGIPVKIK